MRRCVCGRNHLREIQRDNDGNPIEYNWAVAFAKFDDGISPELNEVINRNFVDINSDRAQYLLRYNNQKDFAKQLEKRRDEWRKRMEETYYCHYISDEQYEAAEMRRYGATDMTDEECVMEALESGDSDCYGFGI